MSNVATWYKDLKINFLLTQIYTAMIFATKNTKLWYIIFHNAFLTGRIKLFVSQLWTDHKSLSHWFGLQNTIILTEAWMLSQQEVWELKVSSMQHSAFLYKW